MASSRNEFPDEKGIDTFTAALSFGSHKKVEMSSPMRKGLTHFNICGYPHGGLVEMSSPMRRGLTLFLWKLCPFHQICRNEFPDEKGIDTFFDLYEPRLLPA